MIRVYPLVFVVTLSLIVKYLSCLVESELRKQAHHLIEYRYFSFYQAVAVDNHLDSHVSLPVVYMEIYSIHSGSSVDTTSDSARNVFTACLAEFVGTFMFLFFAFAATQIANSAGSLSFPNPDLVALVFESLAFGVSLAVNLWLFYRISGGMFNPAVRHF